MDFLADPNGKGSADVTFDSIEKQVLYLVDKDSTVDDYIGYKADDYDFDFVNDASALQLKVGDASYSATEIEANHYGFKELGDGTWAYEVVYTPGDMHEGEHFTWKINEPVSNFARVQLTYKVKLTNPKTEAGTYGTYDEDGSKGSDGLLTNTSATLHPIDSTGNAGNDIDFPKPTVSYTVEKPVEPVTPSPEKPSEPQEGGPGAVNLYKVDGQTGAYLAGAVFALYHSDGSYIGTYTTDEKGCINVKSLGYGTYYFKETKAPEGYVLDPTYVRFVMNESTSKSNEYPWNIKVSNTKAGAATVMVVGTKTWDDNNNAAGARPSSVTLHLLANGKEVGTAVATQDSGWTYSFGSQAVADADGNTITYTVSEDPVANYTATIATPVTQDDKMVINVTNTYQNKASSLGDSVIATGDNSHMGASFAFMLSAMAGLAGLAVYKKRKRI